MRFERNDYRYLDVDDAWDNDNEIEFVIDNGPESSYTWLTKGQLIQLREHLNKLIEE